MRRHWVEGRAQYRRLNSGFYFGKEYTMNNLSTTVEELNGAEIEQVSAGLLPFLAAVVAALEVGKHLDDAICKDHK